VGNALALSKQLWSLWVTLWSYPSESIAAAFPQPIPNGFLLKIEIYVPTSSLNSPYHVSLGLCPYIPSFCL